MTVDDLNENENEFENENEYEVPQDNHIIEATIEDEMQRSYIDYSMSVIIGRALPDVRDGLKPVQRRILFGMHELGLFHNKKENKCARIVGEVMGKFHPHGDSSIYMALVRMAQHFTYRYPLVKGQGNFGNLDLGPASMRYTEAKLDRISDDMLKDLDSDTVDFTNNYDQTIKEPSVLPARIPNLLVNGSQGIAVGLATSIPPHNLSEVMRAVLALLDNPEIQIEGVKEDKAAGIPAEVGLMDFVTAPDFPSKGLIYGYAGIREMYLTGRGRAILRGRVEYIPGGKKNERDKLVITEIPYQVSRQSLIEKITELVKEKKIDGLHSCDNESGKETRIVLELKKDANHEVITNMLYKYTPLQISFSGNFVALVNNKPMQLNLKQFLTEFVKHREEVITRRTAFELRKAKDRIHILEGLKTALDNIDRIISIIRSSPSTEMAKQSLISEFALSDIQAMAILAMRLSQLTGLEREKLLNEIAELMAKIIDCEDILNRKERRVEEMKKESQEILDRYGDPRVTEITIDADDMDVEDLIPDDEMVVTISHEGYIKRVSSQEYKSQGRGGTGSRGADSKDSDFIQFIFSATNHNYLMLFTDKGKVFWKKVWQLPEMNKTSKGRPLVNMIENIQGETIKSIVVVKDYDRDGKFLIMATKNGVIKKTALKAYSKPKKNGIIAINLRDNDELLEAKITSGDNEMILGTSSGYANRFHESLIREVGRNSIGVRGINLREGDFVVSLVVSSSPEDTLLVVGNKGYGKRSLVDDFRKTNRGSKGVIALNTTEKVGKMIAMVKADDLNDLMIITYNGIVIRQAVENIRVMGRNTQGVRLISLRDNDQIADICIVPKCEDPEEEARHMAAPPEIVDDVGIDASTLTDSVDEEIIEELPGEDTADTNE